jgi:TetR/AcrR family transcriptional repressor of uid operon
MNVHSVSKFMSQPAPLEVSADRRRQILQAAIACFAERGFHQASMHDISAEAGISVGLIYRYFANKEAVISAMGDEHKKIVHALLERAQEAPSLLEVMEILFTAHCCDNSPQVQPAFVANLYSEAARNPQVADLVRDVSDTAIAGVARLIARSPEAQASPHNLEPNEVSELIFAVARGMLMRDVLHPHALSPAQRRSRQLEIARRLWRLLFAGQDDAIYA